MAVVLRSPAQACGEGGPHGGHSPSASPRRDAGRHHPAVLSRRTTSTAWASRPTSARRPQRLIRPNQSSATLNLIRAFANGGYADLHNIHRWTLGFVNDSPLGARYRELADKISESLDFMGAIGITPETHPEMHRVEVFTSHEALLLGYEEAMTRIDSTSGDWYDTSAHLLWIGERTRQRDHAHVEYMRGIKNPSAARSARLGAGRTAA